MISITLLIFFTCTSIANDCTDDIPRFLEVTQLEDITCEVAYYELHERCEQRIPTAPSYKLVDFCCAFCANLVNSENEVTTTTTTTTTSEATTASSSSNDGGSSDAYSSPTYDPSYAPTTYSSSSSYESVSDSVTTSDDSSSGGVDTAMAVVIMTVLGILFVVGWVILYFQLDKRGFWTRGTVVREKVPSEASDGEWDEESSESGTYTTNPSYYDTGMRYSSHSALMNNFVGVMNRSQQGLPFQPRGYPPHQGMPHQGMPQQGMPHQGMPHQGMPLQGMYGPTPAGVHVMPPTAQMHASPMGDYNFPPPPQRTSEHRAGTRSYSHGPFTNNEADDDRSTTTHTNTFSENGSTTTTDINTNESSHSPPKVTITHAHTRQESKGTMESGMDPIKMVEDMRAQIDAHLERSGLGNATTTTIDENFVTREDSEDVIGDDSIGEAEDDEIHIIVERPPNPQQREDVHVL